MRPTEGVLAAEEKHGAPYHLLAAVVYPMIMFACQYFVMFAADWLQIDIHDNDMLITADLLTIAVLLIWFACRGKSIPKSLAMNKVSPGRILMGIAAGIGLTCALDYVMVWVQMSFPAVMEDYTEHMSSTTTGSAITYILAGVILAPLVEELLFRSLSVKHLDKALPRGLSILLVAGLFGLMHSNLVQGLYAGSLGVLLCALFFAYESVWVPMALHFGFNLVSVVSLIDTESMTETQMLVFTRFWQLFTMLAIFGGAVALVFLFIQRTHSIWFKHRGPHRPAKG